MSFTKNCAQIFIVFCIVLFISIFPAKAAPSDLDLNFGSGGKVFTNIGDGAFGDCQVNDMALQPDGKIIGVGVYNGTLSKADTVVVRLNADGSLDTSFGNDGKVITSLFDESDGARSVALQLDGKIVVVGYAFHEYNNSHSYFTVLRYNTDGSLDNTFNGNGKVLTDFNSISVIATAVAIQPDGKIIATGTINDSRVIAARYNSDGSLDQSFGSGGKVSYQLGSNLVNYSEGMVLQSDGKIIIAGSVRSTPNSSNRFFTISRLNSDGSIDINFGNGGWVSTTFNSNSWNYAASVIIQPDGKIVAAGATNNSQGLVSSDYALARFNPDGTLDTSFNGDGKVTTNIETSGTGAVSSDVIFDVIFNQNKITVSGYSSLSFSKTLSLARYNLDGSLDPTFDSDGKIRLNSSNESSPIASLLIQTDGKIIAGTRKGTLSAPGTMLFIRLLQDGTLDQTFDTNGFAQVYLGRSADEVKTLLIQPDGKIIIAGNSEIWVANCLSLVRYHTNGSIDTSFAVNGRNQTCFDIDGQDGSKDLATVYKLLRQSDGKLLLAGKFSRRINGFYNTDFLLMRFNEDGFLDTSFGENGRITTDFAGSDEDLAYSAALQADGKIVLAGRTKVNSDYNAFAAVRFNSDGTLDTTFDGDGKLVVVFTGGRDQEVKDIVIQPDNKIILGGTVEGNDIGLVKLNPDGSFDTGFGTDGKTRIDVRNFNSDQTKAVKLQNDGKIIVLAVTTSPSVDFALVRLNSNGSSDTSFGTGGRVITDLGHADSPSDLVLQSNGKIVAVGQTYSNNSYNFAAVRYNPNGTLDNSFGVNGIVIEDLSVNKFDSATTVAIQSNGQILVGGQADLPGLPSERDFALVRYIGDSTINRKTPFDFDGDGKSDVSVFRPFTSAWYLLQSQSGFSGVQFGIPTDKLTPADFDGDGKTDIAVFRDGNWYFIKSSNGQFSSVGFGSVADLPRPADFDGDGRADIAVFRPSNGTWYWLDSSSGQFNGAQFGTDGDIPVIADFDADGKSDLAVFRPSTGSWYWLNSSTGQFNAVQFGAGEDIPAVGDFDGDGKTDISVFRPSNGNWYRLNSSNGQFAGIQFGVSGDVPTVGDFDGDGKSDISVFRPSNGSWYLLNSQNGFTAIQFGTNEDQPIPAAFQ